MRKWQGREILLIASARIREEERGEQRLAPMEDQPALPDHNPKIAAQLAVSANG